MWVTNNELLESMFDKTYPVEGLDIRFHGLAHISFENAGAARDHGADVGVSEAMVFEEMTD